MPFTRVFEIIITKYLTYANLLSSENLFLLMPWIKGDDFGGY